MRFVRRTAVGRSIADNAVHAREPQLLKLPVPAPSIPILAPIVSPLVGGSNQNTNPGPTTPANTPQPAQPTPASSSPPNNGGGGASPPSGGSTPSNGGAGSPAPVVIPSSGTDPGGTPPPSASPGDSPTTGSGALSPGDTTVTSPSSGSILEGGKGVTATSSDGLGSGANDPSASSIGGVANAGQSTTGSAGGSHPTGTNNTTSNSGTGKGHISTGAIAAIAVIFITLSLALLIFFLRRRSRARCNERANTWWFTRKRTSQTYGDRNSPEMFTGLNNARSSFATFASHPFHATLPPLLPTAEVGRVNATSLKAAIDASHYNTQLPDERFSISSNYSETSQYLIVNLRNSFQDPTPEASPHSQSFAFPKPPSPSGDRTSAYSRRLSGNTTKTTLATTMKRERPSDELLVPSLSRTPPTPPQTLTGDHHHPSASDPFADNNNPFEDPQRPTILQEIVRQPFQRTRHDEVTVSVGECVHVLLTFDDGWAYVVKVPVPGSGSGSGGGDNLNDDDGSGGIKGLIPIGCLCEPEPPHGGGLATFVAAQRTSSYGGDAEVKFTAL